VILDKWQLTADGGWRTMDTEQPQTSIGVLPKGLKYDLQAPRYV